MKPTLFFLAFALATNVTFSQNFQELADTKFSSAEQYKASEANVLHCANYLLSTAYKKNDSNRTNAQKFIMLWMEGTPDHTFNIDEKAKSLTEGNETLLGLYRAGISKVAIENKDATLSQDAIDSKAEQLLVDYCSKRKNNVSPSSSKLKELIKTRKRS